MLLVANGVFAMSEIAVISARKSRLQQMGEAGDESARAALQLANDPARFLSTVQIGITLVGILAGAFGGATIAEQLGARLDAIPQIAPYGEAIGLGIVVLCITYLSLIFGELVPKRLALSSPERVASAVARPMRALSRVASPVVHLLSVSTSVVLKMLGGKASTEAPITEEEIRILIEQGTKAGVFEKTESELVESVFRLDDQSVNSLMTPRPDIVWLDADASPDNIRRKVTESHYSRFPVVRGDLDDVLGVVKAKELLGRCLSGQALDLRASMRQPLFVPETCSALQLLELFQRAHTHVALVIDEYGAVEGLVTMNDVIEAIVGDMPAAGGTRSYAVKREDGSWLLDGALPIVEFKELFPVGSLPGEERGGYHTLAGFVIMHLGRVPKTADHFEWHGLRFEIVDMDRHRIDKVLVMTIRDDSAIRQSEGHLK